MEAIMSWAKDNFGIICLFVGMLGVLISIASVIYEIKKKRNRKK